jgi:DNA-binding response OmpR family regulator
MEALPSVAGLHDACIQSVRKVAVDRSLILIVEDDDSSREGLAAFLLMSQFRVLTAREGKEGLALARQNCPKLILLDINMPTMDGFAFRAAQRADRAIGAVPVIVISGRHDVAAMAEKLGAHAWLQKPIDPSQVLAAIAGVHPAG